MRRLIPITTVTPTLGYLASLVRPAPVYNTSVHGGSLTASSCPRQEVTRRQSWENSWLTGGLTSLGGCGKVAASQAGPTEKRKERDHEEQEHGQVVAISNMWDAVLSSVQEEGNCEGADTWTTMP